MYLVFLIYILSSCPWLLLLHSIITENNKSNSLPTSWKYFAKNSQLETLWLMGLRDTRKSYGSFLFLSWYVSLGQFPISQNLFKKK